MGTPATPSVTSGPPSTASLTTARGPLNLRDWESTLATPPATLDVPSTDTLTSMARGRLRLTPMPTLTTATTRTLTEDTDTGGPAATPQCPGSGANWSDCI